MTAEKQILDRYHSYPFALTCFDLFCFDLFRFDFVLFSSGQDRRRESFSTLPRRLPQAAAAPVLGRQRVRAHPQPTEAKLRHAQAAHQPAGLFRPTLGEGGVIYIFFFA